MSYISTNVLKNSTIMFLYSEKKVIRLDPSYQRMGGVWTKEKKQLLIDSILNDYDIPKIYFHLYDREKRTETGIEYAVIDGRQRLETIWKFIDGDFTLADDFEYQRDPTIKLASLSYDDIAKNYPRIKIKFDSFFLPVIGVDTDDDDLIEDMFSRLNEAVPLNAAEKRNAIGGELVQCIRTIADHSFFDEKVSFTNKRYQHREVAARLLLLEHSIAQKRIIDTKKVYLDALARNYKVDKECISGFLEKIVTRVLDLMCETFGHRDVLLRAQGNITIYYLLFKLSNIHKETEKITRRKLIDFQSLLKKNRIRAESDYESSQFELLEYDRLTQQGTNDSSNIRERLSVLANHLGLSQVSFFPEKQESFKPIE
ncbi:DUF262 domain-containing protein [Desulfobacula sp.]|uniref:DUF262 domain-containing protein n=1 Tax=Desulfobacula sp. TaxID=2593537 RepID=UPI0025BA087D|nr:DUF262 domain-containing protein [Desulfobacula sp.]MBC2702986.1 DUF262 domain-containing protein [Desulfobacula sp.]